MNQENIELETLSEEWYNKTITLLEIKNAVKSLNNNKSAGLDGVYNEHIKDTFEYFQEWWVIYINNIFNKGKISDTWRTGKMKTLYKGKGCVKDPNMYRGIALMSISYKLYTKILNNRILDNIDTLLPNNKVGFRRGRNCQAAIKILRNKIQDTLNTSKGCLYCIFVDFSKAFDSIDRKILLETLKNINIKGKMYNSIKNIISNFLKIDNGVETSNNILQQNIGVIQGDPLSSTLFLVSIKSLSDLLTNREVSILMFADDLAIYSTDLKEL